MLESLQEFTRALPEALQWLAVMAVSAVPLVESMFGSVIGVVAGLPLAAAVAASVLGNVLCVALVVQLAHRVRSRRGPGAPRRERTPRTERFLRLTARFGVPGVGLLGQWVLPSHLTAALMISFGVPRGRVMLWQTAGITLWGVVFGVLAHLGLAAIV